MIPYLQLELNNNFWVGGPFNILADDTVQFNLMMESLAYKTEISLLNAMMYDQDKSLINMTIAGAGYS